MIYNHSTISETNWEDEIPLHVFEKINENGTTYMISKRKLLKSFAETKNLIWLHALLLDKLSKLVSITYCKDVKYLVLSLNDDNRISINIDFSIVEPILLPSIIEEKENNS